MSQYADARGAWDSDTLKLSWTSDIGISGQATLPRSKATAASELAAVEKSWSEFKEDVAELEGSDFLFRGQKKQWRLRTSFHRAGRADVLRFLQEDIFRRCAETSALAPRIDASPEPSIDTHDDGKRYVVRAEEKLTGFLNWNWRFALPRCKLSPAG
jgi:hypothetical protein